MPNLYFHFSFSLPWEWKEKWTWRYTYRPLLRKPLNEWALKYSNRVPVHFVTHLWRVKNPLVEVNFDLRAKFKNCSLVVLRCLNSEQKSEVWTLNVTHSSASLPAVICGLILHIITIFITSSRLILSHCDLMCTLTATLHHSECSSFLWRLTDESQRGHFFHFPHPRRGGGIGRCNSTTDMKAQ